MPRLLLTRPLAAATLLAMKITALGHTSLIEPLLTIHATNTPPPDFTTVDAVMITSANALAVLPKELSGKLLALPCYCVGARTAEAAGIFGFRRVHHDDGDDQGNSTALAHFILRGDTRHILHLAGADIDNTGADILRQAGREVSNWTVYTATAANTLSSVTQSALSSGQLDGVLIFSTRTAATLATLIRYYRFEACCERLIAIGLSEAVTQALQPLPWRSLTAAAHPTETAVIETLQTLLPAGSP